MSESVKLEQAVAVCPQCEGEGGYPDGLDEAACHTECTRCAGNGWIVDLARLQRYQSQEREAVLEEVRAGIADSLEKLEKIITCSDEPVSDFNRGYRAGLIDVKIWLKELTALTTPAPAVSTEELERLVAHVREGGPHEWGYRDVTDGTFIADDWPFDAAAFLSHLRGDQ